MANQSVRVELVTVNFGDVGEKDVAFNVTYTPGTRESGRFGLPENYDPGSDSELYILSAVLNGVDIYPMFDCWDSAFDTIKDRLDNEEHDERLAA